MQILTHHSVSLSASWHWQVLLVGKLGVPPAKEALHTCFTEIWGTYRGYSRNGNDILQILSEATNWSCQRIQSSVRTWYFFFHFYTITAGGSIWLTSFGGSNLVWRWETVGCRLACSVEEALGWLLYCCQGNRMDVFLTSPGHEINSKCFFFPF